MGKSYHPGCFRCCVCNECLDGVPFTVVTLNFIILNDIKLFIWIDRLTLTIKFTVLTTIIICLPQNAVFVRKVSFLLSYLSSFLKNIFILGITPLSNSEETVRVVSMDKDYHVDCYVCESCNMQLTDEPDKRCYPLDGHLLCRNCHLQRINVQNRMAEPAPISYQFLN